MTLKPVKQGHDDIAFLQYTGGTTGVSKGAVLLHRNIIANVLQNEAWLQFKHSNEQLVFVAALPLYHIYSLTVSAFMGMRIVGMATAGVAPRVMGIGPVPAVRKVLRQTGLTLEQMDLIELNEAFAAQGLAVLRELGLSDTDARVNPNGGAIALGHPLGMSGARLVTTATWQLQRSGGRYALCTMCIGVGQGIAMIIERV